MGGLVENLDPHYRWYRITLIDKDRKPLEYIFRGLTSEEIRKASSHTDELEEQLYVLKTCVLNKVDWDTALAGVTNKLVSEIHRISGRSETAQTFVEAAEWSESPLGSLEAAAVLSIPGLTLEQLQACDPSTYAKYLYIGQLAFRVVWQMTPQEFFGSTSDQPSTPIPQGMQVESSFTLNKG